jgi:hypothetical protein
VSFFRLPPGDWRVVQLSAKRLFVRSFLWTPSIALQKVSEKGSWKSIVQSVSRRWMNSPNRVWIIETKSIARGQDVSILKVSIRQMKAARALLGWSQDDLAARSGISAPTVKRLESAEGEIGGRAETQEALLAALREGGIEFIAENGGGMGVRLAKRQRRSK